MPAPNWLSMVTFSESRNRHLGIRLFCHVDVSNPRFSMWKDLVNQNVTDAGKCGVKAGYNGAAKEQFAGQVVNNQN